MSKRTPAVPLELVEWLEGLFQDRCPTSDMNDREVWIAAGAARVVRKLRQTHEQQVPTVIGR